MREVVHVAQSARQEKTGVSRVERASAVKASGPGWEFSAFLSITVLAPVGEGTPMGRNYSSLFWNGVARGIC